MLKEIQKKLVAFNYITNDPHDRKNRYNITHYLKNLLQTNKSDVVKMVVDDFLDFYKRDSQKGPVEIYDKTAYFKTAINRLLTEFNVPDISFPVSPKKEVITRPRLVEVALEIVEYSTTKWTADFEPWNILADEEIYESFFDDVDQELFNSAVDFMELHRKYYAPLIEMLLSLNDAPDDGQSFKEQLDHIYKLLAKGPEGNPYEPSN